MFLVALFQPSGRAEPDSFYSPTASLRLGQWIQLATCSITVERRLTGPLRWLPPRWWLSTCAFFGNNRGHELGVWARREYHLGWHRTRCGRRQ